jgi:hypothetical protein
MLGAYPTQAYIDDAQDWYIAVVIFDSMSLIAKQLAQPYCNTIGGLSLKLSASLALI